MLSHHMIAADSICYMSPPADISERLATDARTADELHERSRSLLVNAVRTGAAAGLSQREIARAIGRSQPEVSRLLRFRGTSELGRRVSINRRRIIDLAAAHGVRNIRVFGSVAQGTDGPESDLDLLVDLTPGTSLFTLARLEDELAELLGTGVDVVPARNLRGHLSNRVLSEAIPL